MRMKSERTLHTIIFEELFAIGDFVENLGGQIFAVEQEAELSFIERRIVEKSEKHVGGVVMEKRGEVVACCDECLLSVGISGRHATSLLRRGVLPG